MQLSTHRSSGLASTPGLVLTWVQHWVPASASTLWSRVSSRAMLHRCAPAPHDWSNLAPSPAAPAHCIPAPGSASPPGDVSYLAALTPAVMPGPTSITVHPEHKGMGWLQPPLGSRYTEGLCTRGPLPKAARAPRRQPLHPASHRTGTEAVLRLHIMF